MGRLSLHRLSRRRRNRTPIEIRRIANALLSRNRRSAQSSDHAAVRHRRRAPHRARSGVGFRRVASAHSSGGEPRAQPGAGNAGVVRALRLARRRPKRALSTKASRATQTARSLRRGEFRKKRNDSALAGDAGRETRAAMARRQPRSARRRHRKAQRAVRLRQPRCGDEDQAQLHRRLRRRRISRRGRRLDRVAAARPLRRGRASQSRRLRRLDERAGAPARGRATQADR